ncbi:Peptidyl-prolyl cis-trans isomerase PASTICCINO1 [Vitis vinifera]|uniref:peptidylprolyl isomerase n=1 Tax=Vitis vinifera TaxID=29760 RepID=A0A438FGC0_VITVI|nr:Peptidyl-prolyl cis-trans isomerase PASTICCINO1 [Vitis vinifera]
MKAELHYGEANCPLMVPDNFPKDDELHFEIEMLDFFKVISDDLGVLKKVQESIITFGGGWYWGVVIGGRLGMGVVGVGWERAKFSKCVGHTLTSYIVGSRISAKTGEGKEILSHTKGEPYFFTFGKSEVPKGLEMGTGTMTRGEKAVLYVTNQYITQSPLMPIIEGVEEVLFEVELVHFIQVCRLLPAVRDMLGDGRLIKRRIHDGRGL